MTKDLSQLNKEELIEYIKKLKRNDKKFGLVWEDKPEDIINECKQKAPVLYLLKDKCIKQDDKSPNHIIIEGDNYHALSVLNYTHAQKIDVIYIDPPFNTGNKDFTYNDHFIDKEDGYRHSKWLSFMEKRLKLAKNLLTDRGVIFISIDSHEQAHLKLLCDEIFGENNFINQFVWINNLKGRQTSSCGAARTYEYILAYAKKIKNVHKFELQLEYLSRLMPKIYKKSEYKIYEDSYGKYVIKNELWNTNSKFNERTRPKLVFDIYYNPKTKAVICEDLSNNHIHVNYIKITPKINKSNKGKYHAWRWNKDKICREKYNLEFKKIDGKIKIYTKIRNYNKTLIKDIITDITTESGSSDLKKVLGDIDFDYPKPVRLIKYLMSLSENNSIILDFFAGSGTTGQAVLELNREDNGRRQVILCNSNENQIAQTITHQRMKKVITNDSAMGGV